MLRYSTGSQLLVSPKLLPQDKSVCGKKKSNFRPIWKKIIMNSPCPSLCEGGAAMKNYSNFSVIIYKISHYISKVLDRFIKSGMEFNFVSNNLISPISLTVDTLFRL